MLATHLHNEPREPASTYSNGHHQMQSVSAQLIDKVSLPTRFDDVKLEKPKQKRNKPTLSCLECVDRKTKCDRARPCLACIKRQSSCEYTPMANILATNAEKTKRSSDKCRYINKPPVKKRRTVPVFESASGRQSTQNPAFLLSTPFSQSNPSNVFGLGTQHPFENYWTCGGGLAEVIGVLPSKTQSDILIKRYFEVFDPVYPFIHRRSFYADYERFWLYSREEQAKTDPSLVALLMAMYALGTQFMPSPSFAERSQTAEFYCSATHQSLRIYSYLNRTSLRSISTMVLVTYFLMNGNHASDAYVWSGLHLRQAYVMRLHRDPDVVVPDASTLEKQQRRKLWQAVFHQDSFLTVLLKLPPTATHSDVPIESLADENELSDDEDVEVSHSRVENLMSISVIAPQPKVPPLPPQPHHMLDLESRRSDVSYVRSMWRMGELAQETLSSPISLGMPIAHGAKHKDTLITAFQRLYKSFPSHLTQVKHADLTQWARAEPRKARQLFFLTSNYFYCLMLLYAAEDESCQVECDVDSALESAHHSLWAFFHLWQCFPNEAAVWWHFQHRAFESSLAVAHLLHTSHEQASQWHIDRAKDDLLQMMEIMERYGEEQEVHTNRKAVLRQSFEKIRV